MVNNYVQIQNSKYVVTKSYDWQIPNAQIFKICQNEKYGLYILFQNLISNENKRQFTK